MMYVVHVYGVTKQHATHFDSLTLQFVIEKNTNNRLQLFCIA